MELPYFDSKNGSSLQIGKKKGRSANLADLQGTTVLTRPDGSSDQIGKKKGCFQKRGQKDALFTNINAAGRLIRAAQRYGSDSKEIDMRRTRVASTTRTRRLPPRPSPTPVTGLDLD